MTRLRLGLPGEEDDLFEKLAQAGTSGLGDFETFKGAVFQVLRKEGG